MIHVRFRLAKSQLQKYEETSEVQKKNPLFFVSRLIMPMNATPC